MKHEKTFYLHNGGNFSNLEKFAKELKNMDDDIFNHHVNEDKHDFKEWVKHSLKEEKLAEVIQNRLNKLEIELEVLRHLVHSPKKTKTSKKTPKKAEKKDSKKVEKKAPKKVEKKSTKKVVSKAKK